ncbi:MAG: YfiR family protein [Bacteroidales bacterium]|nr:YfiR family protein [Bacteroidales bacterium]
MEWPQQSRQGDFVIGILGNSPIATELETIASKQKIGLQNIVIKTFTTAEKIEDCQILIISPGKSNLLKDALAKTAGKPTLVITDKEGLALQGAGINFITDGNKIKYEINKKNVEKSRLIVNSALMTLGVLYQIRKPDCILIIEKKQI